MRWVSSVGVQAIGPLSAFATVFLIARLGGAAAQGQFAQAKAWVDLLVALGCFGFPQSIVYVVNRLGAPVHRLAWLALAYGALFAPVAWLVSWWGQSRGWTGTPTDGADMALLPALAGVLLVVHGLWRGVYLTRHQGVWFAVFSILPAVSLLAVVAAWRGKGPYQPLLLAAAAVPALVGAVMTLAMLRRVAVQAPAIVPWRPLFANGTHVFAQAVFMVLQPLLAYGLVRSLGGDDAQVGRLNAGVFLSQGVLVPIGLVSPLMFARWTSTRDGGLLARLDRRAPLWVACGAAAGGVIALLSFAVVPLVFGASYRPAAAAVAVMLLTVPLAAHCRLIAPALHAQGRPAINTVCAALRLGTIALVAWALAQATFGSLLAVAVAWSCGETVALGATLWALHQLARIDRRDGVRAGETA